MTPKSIIIIIIVIAVITMWNRERLQEKTEVKFYVISKTKIAVQESGLGSKLKHSKKKKKN